jgi:hypothetical protein
MKNFSKLLIVLTIVLWAGNSFGQRLIVKAGVSFANQKYYEGDENWAKMLGFQFNPGAHLGIAAEVPTGKVLSFEPGLLLTTAGYKVTDKQEVLGEIYRYKGSSNLIYLNLPLNVKVGIPIGKANLFVVAGPYIGMGLKGTYKSVLKHNGDREVDTRNMELGDENDLKRLDYGINMGAGVELSSIQLRFFYSLGLANIAPDQFEEAELSNRVMGLSLGYAIGGK